MTTYETQTTPSVISLNETFKKNSVQINKISHSIRDKRNQMKSISDQMTRILEKNMSIGGQKDNGKAVKGGFGYQDQMLQDKYKKKQEIYQQISEIKSQISIHTQSHEPEITSQIKKKQSLIHSLSLSLSSLSSQLALLHSELQSNRSTLQHYKQSQCLKQIQENQQQLNKIKKERQILEREIMDMGNQEIYMGIYMGEIGRDMDRIDRESEREKMGSQEVDEEEIERLVLEIGEILQERKIRDRDFMGKREQIIKQIKQVQQRNKQLTKQIRQLHTTQLKHHLQQTKQKISKHSSTPSLPSPSNPQARKPNPIHPRKPSPNLRKPSVNPSPSPSPSPSCIIIGSWLPQNLIKDDIISNPQIEISRAINMRVRCRNGKIIGMAVMYIDRIGNERMGRSNLWMGVDGMGADGKDGKEDEEIYVDLQDVVQLVYYVHKEIIKQKDREGKEKQREEFSIGLKFMSKSSRPVIKIGQFISQQQFQHINLQKQYIKTIQFTLDNSYKYIYGIKLTLLPLSPSPSPSLNNQSPQKEFSQSQHLDNVLDPESNFQPTMPQKWRSTSSQLQGNLSSGGLTKKKLFLKKMGNQANANFSGGEEKDMKIQVLNQYSHGATRKRQDLGQPLVDHRLLLNRKKKMV